MSGLSGLSELEKHVDLNSELSVPPHTSYTLTSTWSGHIYAYSTQGRMEYVFLVIEIHIDCGVISPFPLATFDPVHDWTVVGSIALRKGPQFFPIVYKDCCRNCTDYTAVITMVH